MLYSLYELNFARKGHGYSLYASLFDVNRKTIKNWEVKLKEQFNELGAIEENDGNLDYNSFFKSPLKYANIEDSMLQDFLLEAEKLLDRNEESSNELIPVHIMQFYTLYSYLNGYKITLKYKNIKKTEYIHKIIEYLLAQLEIVIMMQKAKDKNNKNQFDTAYSNLNLPFAVLKELIWENDILKLNEKNIKSEYFYDYVEHSFKTACFQLLLLEKLFCEEYENDIKAIDMLKLMVEKKSTARKIFFNLCCENIYKDEDYKKEHKKDTLVNFYEFVSKRRNEIKEEKSGQIDILDTIKKQCDRMKKSEKVTSNDLNKFLYLIFGQVENIEKYIIFRNLFLKTIFLDNIIEGFGIIRTPNAETPDEIIKKNIDEILEFFEEYNFWINREIYSEF